MSDHFVTWSMETWNPLTGCSKISPGCDHCYAERYARRLQEIGQPLYKNGFEVTLHPQKLDRPLRWRKPRSVFVNSMGDLFHPQIPLSYIREVFAVMNRAERHLFQILTKRAKRLQAMNAHLTWTDNIWMGVTVENNDYLWRIDCLRATGARLKFINCEPLLGPLPDLDLTGVDWVLVGGETGPGARPMRPEWALDIRDKCRRHGVPFYFEHHGGEDRRRRNTRLAGRTYRETPQVAPQNLSFSF